MQLWKVEECVGVGANIINISHGGPSHSKVTRDIYARIFDDNDILVVASAGNGGGGAYHGFWYPASYDGVMSVAAVDSGNNRAGFSQMNAKVEISAPGVEIKSTVPGNR